MRIFHNDVKKLAHAYEQIHEEIKGPGGVRSGQPQGSFISQYSADDLNRLRPVWRKKAIAIRADLIKRLSGYVSANTRHKEYVFSKLLRGLGKPNFVTSPHQISTMAVTDNGKIYINLDFVGELLEEATQSGLSEGAKVEGVLLHEAYHVLNHTFYRKGDRDMKIWNVATDYVMNKDLLLKGHQLPSNGLLPENKSGNILQPGDTPQYIDIAKYFKDRLKDGAVSIIDITGMTCEAVYDAIVNAIEDIKEQAGSSGKDLIDAILDELNRQQEATDSHGQAGDESDSEDTPGSTPLEELAKRVVDEIKKNGTDQEINDIGDGTDGGSPEDEDGLIAPGGRRGSGPPPTQELDKSTIDCTKFRWKDTIKDFLRGKASSPISRRGPRNPSVLSRNLGRVGRRGYIQLPLGRGKVTSQSTGDELEAIFIIDVSGSMYTYFDDCKKAIACLTTELYGKFNIGIVLIGSISSELIEIKTINQKRISTDRIFNMINTQWKTAEAEARGYGIALVSMADNDPNAETPTGAIEWIYKNTKDLQGYKYFFIVTDTGWTDRINPEIGKKWTNDVLKTKEICILNVYHTPQDHEYKDDTGDGITINNTFPVPKGQIGVIPFDIGV
jgi:hypothetical protein